MNERIFELMCKANIGDINSYHPLPISSRDIQKLFEAFAKLIVKECGQVLVDNTPTVTLVEDWDRGYDRAMNDCIHHIYEHFGVEE